MNNKTILSVINATTGHLLSTFGIISNTIISLQYDIFQKQLFAHLETNIENVTIIGEIDTTNGNLKEILEKIDNAQPTHISSYCPICRKYFFNYERKIIILHMLVLIQVIPVELIESNY